MSTPGFRVLVILLFNRKSTEHVASTRDDTRPAAQRHQQGDLFPSGRSRGDLRIFPDLTPLPHMGRAAMAAYFSRAVAFACLSLIVAGCVQLLPDIKVESGNPTFGYDVPTGRKPPRTDITLAIVQPVQDATSTVLGIPVSQAGATYAAPGIIVSTPGVRNPVQTEPVVRQRVFSHLQAFMEAARVDLEKIFIAKGLRTMGPFRNIGEMTFSQKRDATFALAPEIHVRLDQSGGEAGAISAGGWFSLILIEPLSGQKIWAKKLDLPTRNAPYLAKTGTDLVAGIALQQVTTDNRAKVSADLLSQQYQDLMGRIWEPADPEEFSTLVSQADELKSRAAPGMTVPTRR